MITGDRRTAATRLVRVGASLVLGCAFALVAGLALPRSTEALLPTALDDDAAVTEAANDPPVANDDPGPACFDPSLFDGAFPIVEDHRNVDGTDQFVLGGVCGLLANDTDADGDSLTYEILTQPANGEATKVDDVFFAYRPDPDFSTVPGDQPGGTWHSDTFTYRAFDGADWSEPATVRFWVAPINDGPTFTPGPTVTVAEDSGAHAAPWATDVSPGPAGEGGQHVQFVITAVESFGVTNLFAEPPDFDSDGNLTFTLGPNEHGYAHVSVHAVDDGGLATYPGTRTAEPPDDTSDSVTFDIVVSPVNDAPVAGDDAVGVTEDQPGATSVAVLGDDTDADGDGLEVSAITNPTQGVATIDPDGLAVSYKPNANAFGADSFTYTVSDGSGATDVATVDVTIEPVNDPPNAVNDGVPAGIPIGTGLGPTALDVLANDTSAPDGSEALTIVEVTQGSHGTVAIGVGGTSVTYDPAGLDLGVDLFTYTISDANGGFDTATVQVLVTADTTAPVVASPRIALAARREALTIRASVSWSARETQSGIAAYRLQRQVDGGTWSTIGLPAPTSTSISLVLASGHGYRFRVRATDGAGNVGIDAVSRRIRL